MCGAFANRSMPAEGSNERPDKLRAAALTDRARPPGLGGARARLRGAPVHPAGALERVHRVLSRLCELALPRSHLDHGHRDAARLRDPDVIEVERARKAAI